MGGIIDGRLVADKIKENIKEEISILRDKGYRAPKLSVVLVGDDPASKVYVGMKEKAANFVGIESQLITLSSSTKEEELLKVIEGLANDDEVDGILVQLPLPEHINEERIINYIPSVKDVDGFHPENLGLLMRGTPRFIPCTPLGIKRLLEYYEIKTSGKKMVVVGRSNIVGKPAGILFLSKGDYGDATVCIAHSKTRDIKEIVSSADILIAAVGKARFIEGDWIKEGAVVIDVGVNRLSDGKLAGDVDFEEAKKRASYITPVPGGVGPMTVAMLMENTLKAFKLRNGISV